MNYEEPCLLVNMNSNTRKVDARLVCFIILNYPSPPQTRKNLGRTISRWIQEAQDDAWPSCHLRLAMLIVILRQYTAGIHARAQLPGKAGVRPTRSLPHPVCSVSKKPVWPVPSVDWEGDTHGPLPTNRVTSNAMSAIPSWYSCSTQE
jgi:hypothetical protein